MNPAFEYLRPFIRRQRSVLRIDIALHLLFIIPIVMIVVTQIRDGWKDPGALGYQILAIAMYLGTVATGFFTNLALLRSWRKSPFAPFLSSMLWVMVLPLLSSVYIYWLQQRRSPVADRLGFVEAFTNSVDIWFAPLALMTFYKVFYLFNVLQYRKWSRASEEL